MTVIASGYVDLEQPGPPAPVDVTAPSGYVDVHTAPQVTVGGSGSSGIAHHQVAPASTWTVTGVTAPRSPVILLDAEPNRQVYADVQHYPSTQTTVIEFPSPVTGWAYL